MSRYMNKFRQEAIAQCGPEPSNATEALTHVLAAYSDENDARMMVEATNGIYGEGIRTGLTIGDLRALGGLADFARWIVALDDVDGPGADERRTITLNRIIERARQALANPA
jgi:hypothetical protein